MAAEQSPLDPAEGVTAGDLIAQKYRVERVLGAGGMGIVVAATHIHLRQTVALKLLRPSLAFRGASVARFLQEARAVTRLRGEHVVRVLDVGMADHDVPFIAMEYLRGDDLAQVLAKRGALRPATAVTYVLQACEALAEAHAFGIIHRDLKPANLFLTRQVDGTPSIKVLDFGISKVPNEDGARTEASESEAAPYPVALGETADPDAPPGADGAAPRAQVFTQVLTQTHAIMGSPRYMSPEQIRSARDVDARSDVWALGAILFELLTGRAAFDANGIEAVRDAILGGPTPAPRALDATIPRELDAAIRTCLRKDANARYADVAALARAIAPFGEPGGAALAARAERVLHASREDDATEAAPPAGEPTPFALTEERRAPRGLAAKGARRRRIAAALAVVAALAATASFAFTALRARSAREVSAAASAQAEPHGARAEVAALAASAESTAASREREPARTPAPPAEQPHAESVARGASALAPQTAAPKPARASTGAPLASPKRVVAEPRARAERTPDEAPPAAAAPPHAEDPLGLDGGELFTARH